ncbi:hypothetical protein SPRG_10897 [Saprolegnia parasitica CBS 223.65]|uniref:HTH CENPB-type domain-containing protein n=1 Tax=Saprolegnia parasitica (strain CBS 223.65) TaxID=695850 RepID=A0A067C009_SAPPC|nr:hypothetical protein SPRG_10897 [Saprolegnia parasitica CBS 223.65]KDO24109.1 hypothetical protein SPRG_10897 [Saprolegnia parasitica CBS 223.65]|eukprot:XP_012205244.1 hypothetical protein SPRG_10897 [Saprolegnia parasitica CBS 223.65]
MPRAREHEQEVPDRLRPRRKRLTVDKQAEIVELLKTTMLSHEAIGNKYGVSRQTVTAIQKRSKSVLKEMECLRGLALTGREHTRRVVTARHPLHPVDLAVYRWLQLVEVNGAELSVTGAVLQARALDFAGALGFPAFKASNGWLQNFTKRIGVHSSVRSGEAASLLITADAQHRINTIITALVGPAPSPHERDDTVDKPFDRPPRTATIDVPSSQRALSASESLREYFTWYEDDDMLAKLNGIVQRIEANASHTTPSAVFYIRAHP